MRGEPFSLLNNGKSHTRGHGRSDLASMRDDESTRADIVS
jgi:hypothetical protein